MKIKGMLIIFLLCFVFTFSGCASGETESEPQHKYDDYQAGYDIGYDSGYDIGYDDGYGEGYNDGYVENELTEDRFLQFQSVVITLMYDYEYETVKKLFEYAPDDVGAFLEEEFGTTDISEIIDYLESERTIYPDTVIGKCDLCGEDIYGKDAVRYWANIYDPSDQGCAHQSCYDENKQG